MAAAFSGESVRVDVWLWSVRLYKTRSVATAACRAGHVRVNGERAKPAQPVRVGDEVVARTDRDHIVGVRALLTKRVAASVAQEAIDDRTPPPPPRTEAPAPVLRERGAGRPTKRERRDLERLRAR
jgi:ribosome-associated heat shock protein Hsp15